MKRELDLPSALALAVDELAAGGPSVDEIVAQGLTLYLNFLAAPDDTLAELMQIRAQPQPLKTARVVTRLLRRGARRTGIGLESVGRGIER